MPFYLAAKFTVETNGNGGERERKKTCGISYALFFNAGDENKVLDKNGKATIQSRNMSEFCDDTK